MSILSLNDDCLLEIFSKCSIRDLMALENVCTRFQTIATYSYRFIHKFTWQKSQGRANEEIFVRIGPFLREITYFGMGNSDYECFRIISKYCERVKRLKLFQISVNLSLVYQMLPILTNIECLEVDEYLTQSESIVTDFSCLILCAEKLKKLRIGRPIIIYGRFITHDYLVALTTVQDLTVNLIGDGFLNISKCFSTNSTLQRVHLVLPDGDYENYHEFCASLVNLTSLVELRLENLKNKSFESLFRAISDLLKLKKLKQLNLKCSKDTTLTTRAQRSMSRMRNLPHLTLHSLKNLTYDFLTYHLWLKTLQTLTLINCPGFTTENLFVILEMCPQLEQITLEECPKVSWESFSDAIPNSIELSRDSRKGIIRIVRENILLPFTIL